MSRIASKAQIFGGDVDSERGLQVLHLTQGVASRQQLLEVEALGMAQLCQSEAEQSQRAGAAEVKISVDISLMCEQSNIFNLKYLLLLLTAACMMLLLCSSTIHTAVWRSE